MVEGHALPPVPDYRGTSKVVNSADMDNVLRIIQLLVAPVVMISANGLLCLALYNRLAAIVSRVRTFHRERFESLTELASLTGDANSPRHRQLEARASALEEQTRRILRRARLVRNSLICLLFAVLLMLGCSLSLGLPQRYGCDWLPLLLFFAGVLCMIIGVALAMVELLAALEPVTAEGFTIEDRRNEI